MAGLRQMFNLTGTARPLDSGDNGVAWVLSCDAGMPGCEGGACSMPSRYQVETK